MHLCDFATPFIELFAIKTACSNTDITETFRTMKLIGKYSKKLTNVKNKDLCFLAQLLHSLIHQKIKLY